MKSPMQLSLAWLRAQGWYCEIVEHAVHIARENEEDLDFKRDLLGFADIIALKRSVLLVQTTTNANVSARVKKIQGCATFEWAKRAGIAVHVHGWGKLGGVRVVDMGDMPTEWSSVVKLGKRSRNRPCYQRALEL